MAVATGISINYASTTTTSITINVTFTTQYGGPGVYVRMRINGSDYVDSSTYTMAAGGSKTISLTKTGLSPGTTYSVEAILCNSAGQLKKDTITVTTDEDPPLFSITDIGSNDVTIYVSHGTGYNNFHIFVRLSTSTSAVQSVWVTKTSSFSYTISGLSPSTDYVINVGYSTVSGTDQYWVGAQSFTTDKMLVTPWDWNIANSTSTSAANATVAQTQKAYTAVTNNGYLTDFSYLVWNDIVNKAYEVLTSRNLSWNTDYATLSATKMTSEDRVMTAARFNSVWWNVGHMVSTGLSKVNTGDIIKGSYFVTLTNAINNSIQ